jgi:hypothetical protein
LGLALILALRLLSPAGFMPAFERGTVAIVVCPDAGPVAGAIAGHHHGGHSKKLRQPCPYAATSAPGALGHGTPPLTALLLVGLALSMGRPFSFLEGHRTRDRPPLRAPPLLA